MVSVMQGLGPPADSSPGPAHGVPVVSPPRRASILSRPSSASIGSPPKIAPRPTLPSGSSELFKEHAPAAPLAAHPTAPPLASPSALCFGGPPKVAWGSEYWKRLDSICAEADLRPIDPLIRGISTLLIHQAIMTYRFMSKVFGFVPLPAEMGTQELLEKRPKLCFAVLIAGQVDAGVHLQLKMARQFRKVAIGKVTAGERSLDLLQSLLVFIAWHHRYVDPKAASIPMLLRICVGIAEDLGLDNRPPVRSSSTSSDREGKRTYIGCYYLATWLSCCGVGKVNVPHSETIKRYAIELEATKEYDTDKALPTIVQLCSVVQNIDRAFANGPMTIADTKWKADYFNDLLDLSATSYTPQLGALGGLELLHHAAKMHLTRRLISIEPSDGDSNSGTAEAKSKFLLDCLGSITNFLTSFTKLATGRCAQIPLVDWTHLLFAFSTLGYMISHSSSSRDPSSSRLFDLFNTWRDKLCQLFPRPADDQVKDEDMFYRFRRITSAMQVNLRPQPPTASPTNLSFAITSSSRQAVSILQDVPAFLPPLQLNGGLGNGTTLPSLSEHKQSPEMKCAIDSDHFTWKFLTGDL